MNVKIYRYVLGVDPAYRNVGLCLYRMVDSKFGYLSSTVLVNDDPTEKKNIRQSDLDIEGIKKLTIGFKKFLYENNVNMRKSIIFAAIEYPHGGARGARSNRCMGLITGMFASITSWSKSFIIENVAPKDSKKNFTGNEKATKKQMVETARSISSKRCNADMDKFKQIRGSGAGKVEHIADAIAAVYWAKRYSDAYKIFKHSRM